MQERGKHRKAAILAVVEVCFQAGDKSRRGCGGGPGCYAGPGLGELAQGLNAHFSRDTAGQPLCGVLLV